MRDWITVACLVYLLGKLAYEMVTGAPLSDAKAIGGHVVTEAHLYGSIVAFIYGLIMGTFTGREVPSPTADSSTATTCTLSDLNYAMLFTVQGSQPVRIQLGSASCSERVGPTV